MIIACTAVCFERTLCHKLVHAGGGIDIEADTFEMRAGEFVNLIELATSDRMWCEYPATATVAATMAMTERRGRELLLVGNLSLFVP